MTIVDDGTATLEFARLWAADEPLLPLASSGARLAAAAADDRPGPMAGGARRRLSDGVLRMFTSMPVSLPGVEVVANTTVGCARAAGAGGQAGADLVGTSLVESGVVAAGALSRRGGR